ncbi:PREDICTED: uncharacterized protein LOC108556400 [Nicrophorus vespilloides]|uniref:Uncharacterized protein LOC108556400 n=1 Tax=Nicrophorus vespilloides TaxID=110193 RepID=A0ABM1M0A2_NICVS|nr:PREDICTED: uncharacterized protein LOC108556400 [Nicrophorus vespilloides]
MLKIFVMLGFVLYAVEGGGSHDYCLDLTPQPHVDIEQLLGMWYGVEIISHRSDAKHEIIKDEACPVLYFSEDRTPRFNQDHPSFAFGDYAKGIPGHQETTPKNDYAYTYPSTNGNYDYRGYGNSEEYRRRKYQEESKRLRLLWDEMGSNVEYNLRYNATRAGFWISSGPQNGSQLATKFDGFAGVVQVLKAVGNHMVLVFCHRLPDPKLYTVLLSRVQTLSKHDVHGVHGLLNRRGLSTNSIRKVCTYSGASSTYASSAIGVFAMLFLSRFC